MKRFAAGLVCAALLGGPAAAAEVAPGEVAVEDMAIDRPLTDAPGDPESGRELFAARKLGNCLACHANADMSEMNFHGEIGPALDGVGDRWNEAELRAIVVDPKAIFGDATIMPAFYRDSGYNRVLHDFEGKTILTAQQVEDVVAYLKTLKSE